MVTLRGRARYADRVADLDIGKTPEFSDLSCGDRRTLDGRPAVEDTDRGDLTLVISAESQPIPRSDGSREHPNVGDLLPGQTAFDLEHGAGNGSVDVAFGRGQQL